MKKVNSRFMIAGLLPPTNAAAVEYTQRRYETKGWHITQLPHITLVRPGTALAEEAAIVDHFSELKLALRPPRIESSGIGVFLNAAYANVVYLKVELSPELTELHRTLKTQMDSFIEDNQAVDNFVPHVTLANNIADKQTVDQIIDEVADDKLDLHFILSEVHLFRKSDTDPRWVWLAKKSIG